MNWILPILLMLAGIWAIIGAFMSDLGSDVRIVTGAVGLVILTAGIAVAPW